jgi:hypothetical protein
MASWVQNPSVWVHREKCWLTSFVRLFKGVHFLTIRWKVVWHLKFTSLKSATDFWSFRMQSMLAMLLFQTTKTVNTVGVIAYWRVVNGMFQINLSCFRFFYFFQDATQLRSVGEKFHSDGEWWTGKDVKGNKVLLMDEENQGKLVMITCLGAENQPGTSHIWNRSGSRYIIPYPKVKIYGTYENVNCFLRVMLKREL